MQTKVDNEGKVRRSFLGSLVGRPIIARIDSGETYKGILACIDGRQNIALEQTEEYVDGKQMNNYGDAFVRGSCIEYIALQRKRKSGNQ